MLKGFTLIPNFITKQEEIFLLECIDSRKWEERGSRRMQFYNYKNETMKPYNLIKTNKKIPDFFASIINKIVKKKLMPETPDQIIVNEYTEGTGLKPHTDRKDYFKEFIAGISLNSTCVMFFTKDHKKIEYFLPPRSLYIICSDARKLWKHGIASRKKDVYCGKTYYRARRISVTFRNVFLNKISRKSTSKKK